VKIPNRGGYYTIVNKHFLKGSPMTLAVQSQVRDVTGITVAKKEAIPYFLRGAVYCWCKNRRDDWFSLRDLMGGPTWDWIGTPLYAIHQKHAPTAAEPVKEAGKDGGWILKAVINDDSRNFETREAKLIREYRWHENHAIAQDTTDQNLELQNTEPYIETR